MALEVIGAGFGRTGTTSLKAALEQLGFSKCHHMQEVAKSTRQVRFWQALADSAARRGGADDDVARIDWDEAFEGYRASCDWPSATYWEELLQRYPDAKLILTVRDEQRWYDSCAETIYPVSFLVPKWITKLVPPFRRFNDMVIATVWDGVFNGRFDDRARSLEIYRDHVAYVKATAPPEKLLVFEAKQGWEPLCRFLDVPVPKGDYPHLNDAARIKLVLAIARGVGWAIVVALCLGALALVLSPR